MTNIFLMALEPIQTRYTAQWWDSIPEMLNRTAKIKDKEITVWNIDGGFLFDDETTPGAFLNFANTNIWKNNQINTLTNHFKNKIVQPGDKILFTDAWHPGILQVKYISELLNIPVEVHSIFHAGSYDPFDFLGRLIKDKRWTFNAERAFFYASDYCYFATNFHIEMFAKNLFGEKYWDQDAFDKKIVRSGQPHDVMIEHLLAYTNIPKENIILFPHRIAPEKQLPIFKDLAESLPQYKWIVCQEKKLEKEEYHKLLGEAKVIFSANLQETLGISAMEGVLVDAIPVLPNRLSYTEMYDPVFLYPSDWTTDFNSYLEHKTKLIEFIVAKMTNYKTFLPALSMQRDHLLNNYLTAKDMAYKLIGV
jgi:hypothetical protein